jgi:hypothetical protein
MPRALENAFADLILGAPLDPADPLQVDAWLSRHGVTEPDAEAIRNSSVQRLLVYRTLIRRGLSGTIERVLPRTRARLDALFEEYLGKFLKEVGPRTHYLRDVAGEFLNFCEPDWAQDERVPRYLPDLARHEACHMEIAAMPAKPAGLEPEALQLDQGVRFIEAVRLLHYEHAVHELPTDPGDRSEPAARAVDLLVYRSPAHDVRYLETTPAAADILRHLLAGATLTNAVLEAAQSGQALPDDAVLQGTARLLADLAERGVLLGAAE